MRHRLSNARQGIVKTIADSGILYEGSYKYDKPHGLVRYITKEEPAREGVPHSVYRPAEVTVQLWTDGKRVASFRFNRDFEMWRTDNQGLLKDLKPKDFFR